MQPQDTARDWRRRWAEIEGEWSQLDQLVAGSLTGDAVNSRNHRLQTFYIQAYHLKDAVISDPTSGLSKDLVEKAVTADPRLALLADLANLDKHFHLDPARKSAVDILPQRAPRAASRGI